MMMNELKRIGVGIFLLCLLSHAVYAQFGWRMQTAPVQTRWAKNVSPRNPLPEYPRPQMVRDRWQSLNGLWEYAILPKEAAKPERFTGKILVPYPLESALSGVAKPLSPDQKLWYRRTFIRPSFKTDERLVLHF